MADRLPRSRTTAISNMAGVTRYTRTHYVRAGVVGVGRQKTNSGMTVTAFRVGDRVFTGRGVGGGGRFTSGNSAVMATIACPGNI